MKELLNKILKSFDTQDGGFSARKLTAFILTLCILYIHIKYVNSQNAIEAQIVDLCGVLIALGIVTAEQIIKFKNGNQTPQ